MSFQPYAVAARTGPHVTLQAGVVHLGRYWTTTSRSSLKARVLRRRSGVGVVVREGAVTQVLAGPTVLLDALRPCDGRADPLAATAVGTALARLVAAQLDSVAGYVAAGRGVPAAWGPIGRVVAVTRIAHRIVLAGDEVVSATGAWAGPVRSLRPDPGGTDAGPPPTGDLTPELAALVGRPGPAQVGLLCAVGPVTLPGRWEPASGTVAMSAAAVARVGARLPGPVCVTVDDSADRRPDRKRGVMVRGQGRLVDAGGSGARVAVAAGRLTAWDGFDTRTVEAVPA